MDALLVVIWLCALADLALLTALARRPSKELAAVAAAQWALRLLPLRLIGLHWPFGVAHIVYLDVVVVLPLAAAVLIGQRARPRWARILAAPALALAPLGLYASFVEPERLVVEEARVEVERERAGQRPVRIAVLADLQFRRIGEQQREAVELAMSLDPDVIVLPGDFSQAPRSELREELPVIRGLFSELAAPGGVYAVEGDAEGPGELERVFRGTRVRTLRNEVARLAVAGRRIAIGGVELAYRSPAAQAVARRLERSPGAGEIRILLAHRPDAALRLERRTRVDLTVAGHTHGGQIQLPFVGPIATASKVPRDVAAGGLHDLGYGRLIYVSRGVGLERGQAPRVRFGATPEVSLIELAG